MGLFSGKKKKSDSRNESRGREVIEGKIEGVTEGPFDDSKYTEYQNKINEISSNIENHTKKLNELLKNLDWNNPDTFKSSLNNVASTANNVNSGFESLNTIKKELKEELTKSDDESKGKIQKLSNTISSVFSSSDKALADKLKKRDLTFPANTPELTKLLADTLRDNLKIPVNTGITINYIYRKAEQAGREELDEFRAMFKLLNNFVNSPPAIQKYLDENNTGVIISKGINGVEGSIQTILDSGCIDLNNVAKSVKDKLSNSNKEADSPIYLKLKFLAGNVSLILEILINRIKSNEKIDKNTNFNYPNKFIKEWNSLKEKYDKSIQNAPVKIDNLYIGVGFVEILSKSL